MKHWYNSGNTLHLFGYNGKINHDAGITIEDGEAYIRSEPGESLLNGAYTPAQLIEVFEEATVWLRAQQKSADPLYKAMDGAAKRLNDLGITATWGSYTDSGMERVPKFLPGLGRPVETGEYKIEQVRPANDVIEVTLLAPATKNLELRVYKVTEMVGFPTYTAIRIKFNGIEEVERFIADNAHLAN